jgi:hypothetical protein
MLHIDMFAHSKKRGIASPAKGFCFAPQPLAEPPLQAYAWCQQQHHHRQLHVSQGEWQIYKQKLPHTLVLL